MIISFSFAENKLSQFSCLVQGKVDAAVGVDAAQVAQEEAGEDTGQQGGQQRAFADAFDGAEAGQETMAAMMTRLTSLPTLTLPKSMWN